MPRELQAHLDLNTEATNNLAASIRSDTRWKKGVAALLGVVALLVIVCTGIIVQVGYGNRDAVEAVQDCVVPPEGEPPGDCYSRSLESQGEAITKIAEETRATVRADLEHAVNVFITSEGGEPVDIVWPDEVDDTP